MKNMQIYYFWRLRAVNWVSSAIPPSNEISGVIFDVGERSLTLEFGATMDSMKLNIPVADDFVDTLKKSSYLHVCAVERGRMSYAIQAPLMKVSTDEDDFFPAEMSRGRHVPAKMAEGCQAGAKRAPRQSGRYWFEWRHHAP